MILAILIATVAWFILAAILFFNPVVDKIYQREERHPAVKALPKNPATIGKILTAVLIQCVLWALVYNWVKAALPENTMYRGIIFGTIISFMKIIPRDIDRLLLTTYPSVRMTIEFVIGIICAVVVGFIYSYLL